MEGAASTEGYNKGEVGPALIPDPLSDQHKLQQVKERGQATSTSEMGRSQTTSEKLAGSPLTRGHELW